MRQMTKRTLDKAQPAAPRGSQTPAVRHRVTMTDVARLARCSQSTVSVVLNKSPGISISASTRDRVFGAAKELGYEVPRSQFSQSARPSQVAVIFDQIAASSEAIIAVDGIRECAWPTGHVVVMCETLNDVEMENRVLDAILHGETDLVIYATATTRKVTVPPRLHGIEPAVVLLNCYTDSHEFLSVIPGEVAGGHQAIDALTKSGHRRIAIITGDPGMDAARDRLKGYRQALATADIPFDPVLVRQGNWQASAGYEHTRALLALDRPPTAIFCSNDKMAIGCYEALKERGLAIPDDISVIGYGDEEFARHLSPQLTTLNLPWREMGSWAIESGLSGAAGKRQRYPITKLECPLVERQSIARPRAELAAASAGEKMRR